MRGTRILVQGFCRQNGVDHPRIPWFTETGGELPKEGAHVLFIFPESVQFSWKNMKRKRGWNVSFKGNPITIKGTKGHTRNLITLNGEGDFRMNLIPQSILSKAIGAIRQDIKKSTGTTPVIIRFDE